MGTRLEQWRDEVESAAIQYGVAWFIAPVEGCAMKQINTYGLYQLANQLAPLRTLPTDAKALAKDQHTYRLFLANYWIDWFFNTNKVLPLELSSDAAGELTNALETVSNKLFTDPPEEVHQWELNAIQAKLTQLETVMGLELQRHQTYLVSQIGGYSMPLLATKAEVNILEDALAVIGEQAKKDFREAGKCLAFEIPTAAGFHAMRATENVLRQYYALVMGKPIDRIDWGTCTAELKKAKANQKVVGILDQIRDLHRNPLMHPQEFLDMKEAISLFDIAKSAIGSVAEEIAKLKAAAAAAEDAKAANALAAKIVPALVESGTSYAEASGTAIKIVR
jgi:hypothetical protein